MIIGMLTLDELDVPFLKLTICRVMTAALTVV